MVPDLGPCGHDLAHLSRTSVPQGEQPGDLETPDGDLETPDGDLETPDGDLEIWR